MLVSRCRYSIQSLFSLHNNFQHLLLYSTNSPIQTTISPNQSYINYLINHLGFSHQQALFTSTKLRSKNVNYSKFSGNADSVVHFLKQHGFDDTNIKKVVSSYPPILASNVDKTLIPKFKLLQDQGFTGSDLVSVISSTPSFVRRHMNSIIHDLRAILGSNENIMKLLKRINYFMTTSALVNLNSNIALLNNEYGLDINVIKNDILMHPGPYVRNTEFFRNILVRVEEELGIPRSSGMFLSGLYLLCCCSKKKIESKYQVLKSFGWTEYDVSELIRRSPYIFQISEENMRKKLGFLMTELGFKPHYLAKHAALLGYNLENRMVFFNFIKVTKGIPTLTQFRGDPKPSPSQVYNYVYQSSKEGIPQTYRMFLYGIYLLSGYSKKNIESKCELFKSFGWTEFEVSELMRKNPATFMKSEENIRSKMGFLMTELRYNPDLLITHPALFAYSLEKRMVPRRRVLLVLKEKALLNYNFYTAITKSETQLLRYLLNLLRKMYLVFLNFIRKAKVVVLMLMPFQGDAKPSCSEI
ncbi:hypothetical protein KSS87_015224 [Heliosperma pusillum]|nr:hypothetical protein KSS87_015224 [Heliosperma pusillum]